MGITTKDEDETFLRQTSDADLIGHMAETTTALRQMCKSRKLSALSEVYDLALNLMERQKCKDVTAHRMTG